MVVRKHRYSLRFLCLRCGQKEAIRKGLEFGNHKGAKEHKQKLKELIKKDVKNAFALPLPIEMAEKLLGIEISPLNVVTQNTIDKEGNQKVKH